MGVVTMKVTNSKGEAKKLFEDNLLWRVLNRAFNIDVKIPYITGRYALEVTRRNLVTTRGKQVIIDLLNGESTSEVTAIAMGTGTTSPAASDTALQTELTSGGLTRASATKTTETTTTTGDTAQWAHTFNVTSTFAVTEEGLFDTASSGGNMLARQTFSAINVVSGDTLAITHKVQIT